jgi:alpha-L-rhamnosidase
MPREWSAVMIGPDEDFAGAPKLCKEFQLDAGHGEVAEAVLHATARGVFTASINGVAVSDDVLSPGWSSYEWRLRYRSYDVTDLVRPAAGSPVALTIALGNGWFGDDSGGPGNGRSTGRSSARSRN